MAEDDLEGAPNPEPQDANLETPAPTHEDLEPAEPESLPDREPDLVLRNELPDREPDRLLKDLASDRLSDSDSDSTE